MIYLGDDGSKCNFKTKRKITKHVFECSLTENFNVHLYPDNSILINDNEIEDVVFVVPTHLPSFLYKFIKNEDISMAFDRVFDFKCLEDKNRMKKFIADLNDKKLQKIPFL
ncbi:hypothetical protein GVAV_001488 [Gurleya vavrai]